MLMMEYSIEVIVLLLCVDLLHAETTHLNLLRIETTHLALVHIETTHLATRL